MTYKKGRATAVTGHVVILAKSGTLLLPTSSSVISSKETVNADFFNLSAIILLIALFVVTVVYFVPALFWIAAGLECSTSLLFLLVDLIVVNLLFRASFGGPTWVLSQLLQPAVGTMEFLKMYGSLETTASWHVMLLNMDLFHPILIRIRQYTSSEFPLYKFNARGEGL